MRSAAWGAWSQSALQDLAKAPSFTLTRGELLQGFEQRSDRQNTHFKKVTLAVVRINCRTSRASVGTVRSLSPPSRGGSSVDMALEVPES